MPSLPRFMNSLTRLISVWRSRWMTFRQMPQRMRQLEMELEQAKHCIQSVKASAGALHLAWEAKSVQNALRADGFEAALSQNNLRTDDLEQRSAQFDRRLDFLTEGVTTHNDRLDRMEPVRQLLPQQELPFAWAAPAPSWIAVAEARIGRPVADLTAIERERSFYSYYSEMGGDHRVVLLEQYRSYFPILQAAWQACNAPAGDIPEPAQRPVLDIGCGAGELLRFLSSAGITATGIDLSESEVKRCVDAGLSAIQANAYDFLLQTNQKYAGIVMLQVIEHLPAEKVLPVLQACVNRLASGGVLMIETLNLRHPLSFNGFYTDPTHQTPLSDNYLTFLLQWLGLRDVGLIYTMPEPVAAQVNSDVVMHYCNFTVFGRKP